MKAIVFLLTLFMFLGCEDPFGFQIVGPYADLVTTKTLDTTDPTHCTETVCQNSQTITYKIEVENEGPDNSADVSLTDACPDGTDYISHTISSGSYDDTQTSATYGEWLIGPMLLNTTETLTLSCEVVATIGNNLDNTVIPASCIAVEGCYEDPIPRGDGDVDEQVLITAGCPVGTSVQNVQYYSDSIHYTSPTQMIMAMEDDVIITIDRTTPGTDTAGTTVDNEFPFIAAYNRQDTSLNCNAPGPACIVPNVSGTDTLGFSMNSVATPDQEGPGLFCNNLDFTSSGAVEGFQIMINDLDRSSNVGGISTTYVREYVDSISPPHPISDIMFETRDSSQTLGSDMSGTFFSTMLDGGPGFQASAPGWGGVPTNTPDYPGLENGALITIKRISLSAPFSLGMCVQESGQDFTVAMTFEGFTRDICLPSP